ncbi:MAG: DNA polymerase III subunit beta [Candidatus Marinimicrobia bacterium]|nr:DNA polymerase III subunit beta [Candidatus Neomarinimicrobiota bacterium]
MKFSTSKTELHQALQKLNKATPTRSTLPILGCVLIEASEHKTTLRSTDLEITIEVEISVSLEAAGSVALPIKTLFDITVELPETRITLSVDEKNRTEISTSSGVYDLMGKPADEFPKTPSGEATGTIQMDSGVLKDAIGATSFAISKDELKPALTGALFRFDSECLTVVATDGHRLVRYTRSDFKIDGFKEDFIVPKKFLTFMSAQPLTGSIKLETGKNYLTARFGQDMVLTRLIDESFPNYESVIPNDNEKTFFVDKSILLGAIRRVSIFSNKSTHQVALNLSKDGCKITTEDPEKSSRATEKIPGEYDGEDISIGYNAEYLKDVVHHIRGEKALIKLNTPISAALFSPETEEENIDSLMLLMPIRLND